MAICFLSMAPAQCGRFHISSKSLAICFQCSLFCGSLQYCSERLSHMASHASQIIIETVEKLMRYVNERSCWLYHKRDNELLNRVVRKGILLFELLVQAQSKYTEMTLVTFACICKSSV